MVHHLAIKLVNAAFPLQSKPPPAAGSLLSDTAIMVRGKDKVEDVERNGVLPQSCQSWETAPRARGARGGVGDAAIVPMNRILWRAMLAFL